MIANFLLLTVSTLFAIVGILFYPSLINMLLVMGGFTLSAIAAANLTNERDSRDKRSLQRCNIESKAAFVKEFDDLRALIGVSRAKMIIVPRSDEAKTFFCFVLIGENCCAALDTDIIRALLAHELAHVKNSHTTKGAIMLLPFLLPIAALSIPAMQPLVLNFMALAINLMIILCRPIHWPQEYEADLVAARIPCVGRDKMIKCIEDYSTLIHRSFLRDSILHPSVSKRRTNLESNIL